MEPKSSSIYVPNGKSQNTLKFVKMDDKSVEDVVFTSMKKKNISTNLCFRVVFVSLIAFFSLVITLVLFSWMWDKENEIYLKSKIIKDLAAQLQNGKCKEAKDPGTCKMALQRWYFDGSVCSEFIYGGCNGNDNNFKSAEDCLSHCGQLQIDPPVQEEEDPCSLEPETGPCRGLIPRFFFDKRDGICKEFNYGGCSGNSNNFHTKSECLNKCQKEGEDDPCKGQIDPGPCRGSFQRWYYDHNNEKCSTFNWGGCDGNSNNFVTRQKCEQRCSNTSLNPCLLPADSGVCRALYTRYYYNSETGKCETFTYGGCNGNENNFGSIEQCQTACLKPTGESL